MRDELEDVVGSRHGDAVPVAMHSGQLEVTAAAVRVLVDQQFPAWRRLPVQALPLQGTVNALFRLGTQLVARFPLVPGAVDVMRAQLESEARAARELLGRTRFPTPEPVALGRTRAGLPDAMVGADLATRHRGHRGRPGPLGRPRSRPGRLHS